jgi:putative FmdB family regulatory protein
VPTYDYQCRTCGHTIEVIHSMLDEGPTTCERCGGELRRILHPAGIIFKGSGFYKTDSRSSTSASVASGTKKPAPTSGDAKPSGAEAKGDATPGGSSRGDGGASPSERAAPAAD